VKKPLLRRIIDFILRRKESFIMPGIRFVFEDGRKSPLINLDYSLLQPIELPFPVHTFKSVEIVNPNDYPVMVELQFIGKGAWSWI